MINIDYRAVLVMVAAGAGLIWWQQRNIKKVAAEFTEPDGALNPTSENNIANRAFDGLWKGLSGSDESFGADMYDLFHTGSIYGD